MYYVYLLKSANNSNKNYIGYTIDIQQRLDAHNSGNSIHTQQDKPWKLITYIAFDCKKKALDFEKYLKVGSGKAFANKRFL